MSDFIGRERWLVRELPDCSGVGAVLLPRSVEQEWRWLSSSDVCYATQLPHEVISEGRCGLLHQDISGLKETIGSNQRRAEGDKPEVNYDKMTSWLPSQVKCHILSSAPEDLITRLISRSCCAIHIASRACQWSLNYSQVGGLQIAIPLSRCLASTKQEVKVPGPVKDNHGWSSISSAVFCWTKWSKGLTIRLPLVDWECIVGAIFGT
ncbi:hypothetical protein H8959_011554 [Pygathrix nigripes]